MNKIYKAVEILKEGGIIALPTETVYGLAVDAHNPKAIERLYELKGRSENKPTSIVISNPCELKEWVSTVTPDAQILISQFWPGPLTIVLPASENVFHLIHRGFSTIGIRCSPSPIVNEVLHLIGNPLCLTSANPSGSKEAVTAKEIYQYFSDSVFVLEEDQCITHQVSSIIDLSTKPYRILRQGAIPSEEILACIER